MQNLMNRRWLLASYPAGMPTADNWSMDTQPVPDPGAGQILLKAKWLSVDPYMRGRISPATNYTKGTAIGEVMQGGGVGEVVVSNHPAWKVGDIAESMSFGWQEWSVLTPDIAGPAGVNRIDGKLAPIESSLSWLGMPGITAYFGPLDVRPAAAGRHRRRFRGVRSGRTACRSNRQTGRMPRGGGRGRRRQAAMVPR